jgi:zinc transporter
VAVEADFRLGAKPAAAVTEEVIPGLVWGVRCSGAAAAPIGEAVAGAAPGEWLWLHFNLADRRAPAWLAASALVPKPAMERLLSTDETQQIVPCGASVAGVFFDLLHDFDRTIDEFGHFRFVLTEQLLLTGRRHALTSVEAVRQRVETGHRFASPVDLLAAIVAQIAATIERVVGEQADTIDRIEDTVLKAPAPDNRARLGATRLTSVRIHRRLNGLRGVLRRLSASPSEGLMSALCHAAGPLAQRLDEIDQEVIELRDRARLLQEELSARMAEETNRHLHVLSIVTTLLLPPTVVTGLFGMNLEGLPFSTSSVGFWLALAVAFGSSAAAAWVLAAIGVFRGRRDG